MAQDMPSWLESAVAIVDEVLAGILGMILKVHGEVSSLLFDPTFVRAMGGTGVKDGARGVVAQENQDRGARREWDPLYFL